MPYLEQLVENLDSNSGKKQVDNEEFRMKTRTTRAIVFVRHLP